jgi:hypothetical protein
MADLKMQGLFSRRTIVQHGVHVVEQKGVNSTAAPFAVIPPHADTRDHHKKLRYHDAGVETLPQPPDSMA